MKIATMVNVAAIEHVEQGFLKLKEMGYDSWIIIEREISGEEQNKDIQDAKVYLEEIVSEIYGGQCNAESCCNWYWRHQRRPHSRRGINILVRERLTLDKPPQSSIINLDEK